MGDVRRIDEVTKLPMHQCLMMLAFEKDKYELEESIIKSNRK